jgi:cyclic pyranopterin phosphate synthase
MSKLTHIDDQGRARMVDVSDKPATAREAVATGFVRMSPETLALASPARAARATSAPWPNRRRHGGQEDLRPDPAVPPAGAVEGGGRGRAGEGGLSVTARVKTTGPTGVEMEALTAVSVACLTIYDMLKAAEKGMVIEAVRLLEKTGGKSGDWRA